MESCLTTIIKSLSVFLKKDLREWERMVGYVFTIFCKLLIFIFWSGEGGLNKRAPQISEFSPVLFMAFTLRLCFLGENIVKLST